MTKRDMIASIATGKYLAVSMTMFCSILYADSVELKNAWTSCGRTLRVYDGTQIDNVRHVDVEGADEVVLSLRAASPKNENPTFKILAEYGSCESNGCMRISFNSRHERRICGYFGGKRIFSRAGILDDGKLHHVALSVLRGKRMALYVDGVEVGFSEAPDYQFPKGYLAIAQRVYTLDPFDADWWKRYWATLHFRGIVDDVVLRSGSFDPSSVAGGPYPRTVEYTIKPDPFGCMPKWEKPKTTRRYLHGPFSERMYTFWREGKIVYGDVEHTPDWSLHPKKLEGHAIWLVHGKDDKSFDFRSAQLSVTEDGIPEHSQTWRDGDMEVTLSAAVPFGRKPTGHVRLSVKNNGAGRIVHPFAFLVRADKEMSLVFDAPDVYRIYNPAVESWFAMQTTNLVFSGKVVRCGDRFVAAHGDGFSWDAKKGAMRFTVALESGETCCFELDIGKGAGDTLSYDQAVESMRSSWKGELAKLSLLKLPADKATACLARNFAVQMLQCLAMPTNGDFVLPRQGGLQRFVWPWDAADFLAGLDLVGYGGYVRKVIDFYFGQCQQASGEFGPFRHKWACDTSCVLESFANHCIVANDTDCWRRYRDSAMRAFGWIERKRLSGGGLFPSMISTDAGVATRHWVMTDARNVLAYKKLIKAAEFFRDDNLLALKTAEGQYRAEMVKVLDVWRAKYAGMDELRIPSTTDGEEDDALERLRSTGPGALIGIGVLTEDELFRVRRWLLRRGYAHENGLYKNFASRDSACAHHIWYTTSGELLWLRAWLSVGRKDMAEKALEACMLTAVTDEYYVGERYHDANPWYYPWSPNASGMGRILQMISEIKKQ